MNFKDLKELVEYFDGEKGRRLFGNLIVYEKNSDNIVKAEQTIFNVINKIKKEIQNNKTKENLL